MKVEELFEETAAQKAYRLGMANKAKELAKAQKEAAKKQDRDLAKSWNEQTKKDKAAAEEKRVKDYEDAIDDAIAYAMDGGDPSDKLYSVLKSKKHILTSYHSLDMKFIDKVANKMYGSKKGFYGILADMWQDHQDDLMFDAERILKHKNPHLSKEDFDSNFIDFEGDKPVRIPNPFRNL